MNILVAPDSFKGSISSTEICNLFLEANKDLELSLVPLADGGEGSLEVISGQGDFEKISLKVFNPLFNETDAYYLFDKYNKTAYVELAMASGLMLLDKPDVMNASTYGTGQLIENALRIGAKKILLFAGGSATNDAGIGIAAALGLRFYDGTGELVRPIAKNLTRILKIDRSNSLLEKYNAKIQIAVDVKNPFYGKNGAAYTYAAQKGASNAQILFLDKALRHIARVFYWKYGIDVQKYEGSGAAGGVAGGLSAIFNAEIISASKIIFDLVKLEKKIKSADIIISGEGKIDKQSLNGKLLLKVAELVQKHNKKLWTICGYFENNEGLMSSLSIEKLFSLAKNKDEIEEAVNNVHVKLKKMIKDIYFILLKYK